MRITTIGLLTHPNRPCTELTRRCALACQAENIRLFAEPSAGLPAEQTMEASALAQAADALIVFGGDGTMLHAVSRAGQCVRPMIGINTGTLGFLTVCGPEGLEDAIHRLAVGDYTVDFCARLQARVEGEETVYTALNDIALTRGSYARVLKAEAFADGDRALHFQGDGLLISTPTGSTAYALAAGGPILMPGVRCLLLMPLCPHALASRPVIIPDNSELIVHITPRGDDGGFELAVDGQKKRTFTHPITLNLRRAEQALPLIRMGNTSFFGLLQNKLTGLL